MTLNHVALVTGASHGLGAAIAQRLAEKGMKVAVNYHSDHAGAQSVVDKIRGKNGIAENFCYDITDPGAVKQMVVDIQSKLGIIDVVVNNATGPQPLIPIEEQTWQDHLNQLNFFVKAPLMILQAVLPEMKGRKWGRIINIGSEVVELGNPEFGHYVAAKGAMLGLTRSWANELGKYGITVNLVAPGWILVERHRGVSSAVVERYTSGVPLGHQGSPTDVAEAVTFLAGEAAGFITGQKLAINGGKTLC